MQTITPFLWFDNQAEEAMNYYVSVFKRSSIETISRYGEGGPGPVGAVMTAVFELNGQRFIALNGGPEYKFTPAISFAIVCETQDEIDELWEKLSDGGEKIWCGWLTDKFGVTWQVVPKILPELLSDEDRDKADRVMAAMMQMQKLDIPGLQRAYGGD